jgi:hypothetical protein
MTCRSEILKCIAEIKLNTGRDEFSIEDVIQAMVTRRTGYKESTIRTHITSRMCANASQNHAVKYRDIERIATGLYRLADQ